MSDFIWATGRRKEASAQVRMRVGNGKVMVNKREFENYFPTESMRGFILQPLQVTNSLGRYEIQVTVRGGGQLGQAGAMRHGLSRVLVKLEQGNREVLKKSGMLTRDARVKERKKAGQRGARRRFQFSKR
jgi:small subunit ribosomal protein S9